MSKKTRLKIGEFSQLMQVTVKTLRHYEQKGLLAPDEVDEWTGYRYYSIDQMQHLNDIRDLQRLGFSLDEIKDLFDDGSHTPTIRQMTEKIRETEAQLKALIARRNQLLDWRNARKEMKTMEKFSIQSLPEIIVASHREVIPDYAAIGPMCVEKIGPEMQRLGCMCPPHLHPRPDVEVQRGTLEVPRKWRRRETKSTHVKQSLFLWLREDDIIAHLRPTFMLFLRQTAITL